MPPGPVFARIVVRETLLGRLAAALFRPSALTFDDGMTTKLIETAWIRGERHAPPQVLGGSINSRGLVGVHPHRLACAGRTVDD